MTIALVEALTFGLGRLADAAAATGERLCLLTGHRSIYTHELSRLRPGQLEVVDVDTAYPAACAAALREIADLSGIISSTDTWALVGAELMARFGLPGPDPAAVPLLRDKAAVRRRLYERGLSRGDALAATPAAVAEIGFPLVLKDSAGTSSRAVWLVRDRHELDRAWAAVEHTPPRGVLIAEPYFAGPLYSAETLSWQGNTRLLGVLSRQLSPEPRRREEAAAFPVAFPERDLAELQDWIAKVLDAAEHRNGFAHTEFVLTADGPEVVEINARIGGALVGEALCRSLGVNVYTAMIDIALGREPALLTAPRGSGPGIGFVLVYPTEAGVLTGWSGLERLPELPGAPEWYPTATIGDTLEYLDDQRGCTGILLAEGPTAELALHRASAAAGGVHAMVR